MPRIDPVDYDETNPEQRAAWDDMAAGQGRMTNMKRTLLHSLPAYQALMEWYPLRAAVIPFLGERLADIFCHAISSDNDCLICSTYFRRALIDAGEDPEAFVLDEREQLVVDLGRCLAQPLGRVPDELWSRLTAEFRDEEMVALVSFGAMMVATNLFNNAVGVELDGYLEGYRGAENLEPRT